MLIEKLSKYGNIKHQYEGKGKFRNSSNDCAFGIVQLSHGSIYMICEFESISDGVKLDLNEGDTPTFIGETKDGKPLVIEGELIPTNSQHSSATGITLATFLLTGKSYLGVGNKDFADAIEFRFNITNFIFVGTQAEQISKIESRLNALKFQLSDYSVMIRKVINFPEIENQLSTRENTDVTCQAILKNRNSSEIENVVQVIDDLCGLLTIANATLISWISFEIFNSNGEQIFIEHRPSKTENYSSIPLIDRMPPKSIEDFVNKTYSRYLELNPSYNLISIGRIYSSIRVSSFIEVRSLTVVSSVEFLIKKSTGYQPMNQAIKNKSTLRTNLRAFIEFFCIPLTDEEIADFITSRNSLVHELSFSSSSGVQEYKRIVHFFDRLLLGMLDYRGYYINFTKNLHYVGDETDYFEPKCLD